MQAKRFAVVDLETTGSKMNQKDKIIQFACSLIENGEIQDSIEFKVNPDRNIPRNIERLTGIRQDMVQDAVYFFEVADSVSHLLTDCIFVAHNVEFDYNFLNMELKAAGKKPLNIPAIDTVTLSRILFPQAQTYTLKDLNQHLDLGLEQAHDAEEDAQATAQLLIKLIERAKELPDLTLQTLSDLSHDLPFQTGQFFDWILKSKDRPQSDEFIYCEGIVLKKDRSYTILTESHSHHYPRARKEKEELLQDHYKIRDYQVEMMDQVHDYLTTSKEGHLALESASGSGKTLAYLLPAVFLASYKKPVCISTHSVLLQHQLVEKDIENLKEVLDFDLNIAILKSQQHYVDIEAVSQLVKSKLEGRIPCLYVSKLLVWLTETDTGDLNEIISEQHSHPIWTYVRSTKDRESIKKSPWSDYDFFLKSRRYAKEAHMIVSNHAYLAHHIDDEDELFENEPYFIIDEAHRMFDYLQESSSIFFSFQRLAQLLGKKLFKKLTSLDYNLQESRLVHRQEFVKPLEVLTEDSKQLEKKIYHIIEAWVKTFHISDLQHEDSYQQALSFESIDESFLILHQDLQKELKSFTNNLQELLSHLFRLYANLQKKVQYQVDHCYELYDEIKELQDSLSLIIKQMSEESHSSGLWIEKKAMKDPESFSVICYHEERFQHKLAHFFNLEKVIYTSASLDLVKQVYHLHEDEKSLTFSQTPAPFDYSKQTRVLLPETLLPIKEMSKKFYEQMLAYYILFLSEHSSLPLLVLFNSLDTMNQVYKLISKNQTNYDRPFLVQGVHGSKNRLIRQFSRIEAPILLGSQSFWEGIDLPGDSLSLIVISRLPFDSPDDLWQQIRSQSLLKKKGNPFYQLALPRARQKLKQAFGRLVRNEEDKGIMILLDDRFLKASYASYLQEAIPKETPIQEVSMEELKHIDNFFNEN